MSRLKAIFLLFLVFSLPIAGKSQPNPDAPFWGEPEPKSGFKELFGKKEKPPASEEEMFKEALSYFEGRPTFLAKICPKKAEKRKTSKASRFGFYRIDYQRAIELFQKLVYEYPFTRYLADADFYIAESNFRLKEYEVALQAYQDFLDRHRKDSRVEYVYFQLGNCHWQLRREHPLKDQTRTINAVENFESFIMLYPTSEYAEQAEKYIKEGREALAERENRIGDFYFKRKEFWSASLRYHTAWSVYPETRRADYALYREWLCLKKLNREEEAERVSQYLLENYPDSKYLSQSGD